MRLARFRVWATHFLLDAERAKRTQVVWEAFPARPGRKLKKGSEQNKRFGDFVLEHDYPHRFNPETRIRYHLSEVSDVDWAVFDVNGRLVRTLVRGRENAGTHTVTWDGRAARGQAVASGICLYLLVADGQAQMRRMVVLR